MATKVALVSASYDPVRGTWLVLANVDTGFGASMDKHEVEAPAAATPAELEALVARQYPVIELGTK